jgi:hypothetical protein
MSFHWQESHAMRTKRWIPKRALLGVALLVGLSGCTPDFATDSEANVILRILSIEGESGEDQELGAFINSDVVPIFNDNATVDLQALPKNPNLTGAAPFEDVLVTRYEVRYIRSDGHNREGVDVPYRITGGLSTLVPYDGDATEVAFVVVRHQAKFEPPLSNLVDEPVVLTCIAEITLHGQTTSGRAVSTRGFLTINFANFADN